MTVTDRVRGLVLLLVAALVGAMLAACGNGGDEMVRRDGAQLTLGGQPFRFVGFNLYDAAASDIYSCAPQARLDDSTLASTLRTIRDQAGASVVRFWAYQTYTAGGTDFSGMDRFLGAAREAGLKVIPVLEDGPGYCSTGQHGMPLSQVDQGHWYSQGYRQPLGSARLSYREYARVVADRYKDDTTVLGWMMVNEAETTERDSSGRSALVSFAGDMAGVIRGADPNHLVTLGTQSNGAPGVSGPDFRAVYAQSGLDFAEVHDWDNRGSDTEAMPGAVDGRLPDPETGTCTRTDAPIACSFALARVLDKPIIVGEAGIAATDDSGRQRRAQLLAAKMRAAFAAGASGYLVWHLGGDDDDLLIRLSPPDPILSEMRAISTA